MTDYKPQRRKTWRAIMLDWETIANAPDGTNIRILSDDTITALLSLAEYLSWITRYNQDALGSPSYSDALAFREKVIDELMNPIELCCDEILVALNQVNAQITNQTKASGESQLSDLSDTYDGTPGSIAPDIVYDGGSGDGDRDAALCYALFAIIDATLDAIASDIENWKKETAMVAGAVASLGVTLAGFTAGMSALVGTALAGGIALISQAYMATVSEDDLRDADAREDVLCLAYGRLEGATPTAASFAAAFAYDSSLSDVADRQRGIMATVANDIEVYFGFARLMNEGYEISANVGLDNPCVGCGDCGDWEHYDDFRNGWNGWENYDVQPGYAGDQFGGVYSGGVGIVGSDASWTDGWWGIAIDRVFTSTTVNRVILRGAAIEGNHDKGTTYGLRVIVYNGSSIVSDSGALQNWTPNITDVVLETGGVTATRIVLVTCCSFTDNPNNAGGDNAYAVFESVRVCGDGTDPL